MPKTPQQHRSPILVPGAAHPDLDVTVKARTMEDGTRMAVFVPAFVKKMNEDQFVAFHQLQDSSQHLRDAQDKLHGDVAWARREGVSWNVIAWALGLSTSAVHQRFRHVDSDEFNPDVDI